MFVMKFVLFVGVWIDFEARKSRFGEMGAGGSDSHLRVQLKVRFLREMRKRLRNGRLRFYAQGGPIQSRLPTGI